MWRRERALARETLSMTERHAPRLARSWREERSWQSSSNGSRRRGSVWDSDLGEGESESIGRSEMGDAAAEREGIAGEAKRISLSVGYFGYYASAPLGSFCLGPQALVDYNLSKIKLKSLFF